MLRQDFCLKFEKIAELVFKLSFLPDLPGVFAMSGIQHEKLFRASKIIVYGKLAFGSDNLILERTGTVCGNLHKSSRMGGIIVVEGRKNLVALAGRLIQPASLVWPVERYSRSNSRIFPFKPESKILGRGETSRIRLNRLCQKSAKSGSYKSCDLRVKFRNALRFREV